MPFPPTEGTSNGEALGLTTHVLREMATLWEHLGRISQHLARVEQAIVAGSERAATTSEMEHEVSALRLTDGEFFLIQAREALDLTRNAYVKARALAEAEADLVIGAAARREVELRLHEADVRAALAALAAAIQSSATLPTSEQENALALYHRFRGGEEMHLAEVVPFVAAAQSLARQIPKEVGSVWKQYEGVLTPLIS